METERICQSCRKPLPPDVPLGLCPECLMKSGLDTAVGSGTEASTGAGFVPPPVAEIAKLFPQLEVLEFIGKGGMGAVYKARQPALDRLVALKILPPTAAEDPGFAQRFNREARALARLNHPNIVIVHDFGQAGTLHYLVMEFVDGGNLRQIERAGSLTPEQALAIVPQICEALQFAHNEGIVHRDIKPENILLDRKGRVKITDFGIAKILGVAAEQAPLTGARDVVGTPHYMAPEQIEKPRTVDHRADIYSLGVVFYEMLTGELPLGKFAPPSRKVQVDVRLDEVVLHALEKEPDLRYQQASQVKTAVETIAKSEARGAQAEGAAPGADADALEREILARDYVLDIGSCVRRGWALLGRDFWPLVGTTALILVLLAAATSFGEVSQSIGRLHFNTSLLSVLLGGPLMGGLYFFLLKKIRGEPVRIETAFAGFSHSLLHLFLAGFVGQVLTVLGFLCFILPGIYLFVAWFFSLPLVIDQRLEFWPAMRLSRKTIALHWWKFLWFLIVLGLLNVAGLMVCGVGIFVTLPVSFAALMYAYEDIFHPGAVSTAGQGPRLPPVIDGPPQTVAPPPPPVGPSQAGGFFAPFLIVSLLVFGLAAIVTALLPRSYVSTARIKVTANSAESEDTSQSKRRSSYDPYLVQTELEVMQSDQVLGPVIENLGLNEKWGKRYGTDGSLNMADAVTLLKARLDLRPVRNTSVIAINVQDEKPAEAAALANEIAEVYRNHDDSGSLRVEVVDRASPARRPIRPNTPLNLAIGLVIGLVLGTVAGAVRVARQARRANG